MYGKYYSGTGYPRYKYEGQQKQCTVPGVFAYLHILLHLQRHQPRALSYSFKEYKKSGSNWIAEIFFYRRKFCDTMSVSSFVGWLGQRSLIGLPEAEGPTVAVDQTYQHVR